MIESIRARLDELRAAVDDESRACGRQPGSVRILAVTKQQPASAIAAAVSAGVPEIGENYVQEAKTKFAELGPMPVSKHFIGHFQTNKAKIVAELFDVVQSVDRPDAARALAKAASAVGKVLPVLIQINISPTERFGCPPEEAEALGEAVRSYPSLRLDGVMAIGPLGAGQQEIAAAFAVAAKTFAALGGNTLSIGMSGDWREAVRAGSTMIRIGTALFGERRY